MVAPQGIAAPPPAPVAAACSIQLPLQLLHLGLCRGRALARLPQLAQRASCPALCAAQLLLQRSHLVRQLPHAGSEGVCLGSRLPRRRLSCLFRPLCSRPRRLGSALLLCQLPLCNLCPA